MVIIITKKKFFDIIIAKRDNEMIQFCWEKSDFFKKYWTKSIWRTEKRICRLCLKVFMVEISRLPYFYCL